METYPDQTRNTLPLQLLFLFIVLISIASLLGLGYFIGNSDLVGKPQEPLICENPEVIPVVNNNDDGISEPTSAQSGTEVKDGDNYFNDTIFVLTETTPAKILVATVTRTGQNERYSQTSRASYFDGNDWTRDQITSTNSFTNISNDPITKEWEIKLDQTRVMRQTVKGAISLKGTDINFTTETLGNEIAIRSLPEYTKFFSTARGTLQIQNEKPVSAKILYSRIYSTDANTVIVYDQDFPFTTDWLAFWGDDGTFYHFDKTQVEGNVDNYASHAIGFEVSEPGVVKRTFSLVSVNDNTKDPKSFEYTFTSPISKKINIVAENSFQKYPTIKYPWIMGVANGTIQSSDGSTIKGIGIYEFIKN